MESFVLKFFVGTKYVTHVFFPQPPFAKANALAGASKFEPFCKPSMHQVIHV